MSVAANEELDEKQAEHEREKKGKRVSIGFAWAWKRSRPEDKGYLEQAVLVEHGKSP
jgi:hypothetical protein